MGLISRSVVTSVAAFGLALFTAGAASAAPILLHEYKLNESYADELAGPSLGNFGGALGPTGYTYGYGQGLSLTGALGAYTGNYTLEIDFSLSDGSQSEWGAGGWQKLIDFAGLSNDLGLYYNTGGLDPLDPGVGLYGNTAYEWGSTPLVDNTPAKLWLTRNDMGFVEGRLGGPTFGSAVTQFQWNDAAEQDFAFLGDIIHFFMDDESATLDNGTGFVDNIRIYGGSDLDINGAPIPEPATLLLFGSGMALVARRVRRRQTVAE